MSRVLAVAVVVIAFGGVIATHSSSVARPPRPARAVAVTPRLKRLLQGEISTMRLGQPTVRRAVPRAIPRGAPHVPLTPSLGASCYVAGAGRCSEIPCVEFASTPAVLKTPTEIVGPGGRGRSKSAAPPCSRHRPRKLVLASGP